MVTNTDKKRLPFYNYNKLWSHNGYYNFVVGSRGTGKTYGAKVKAIRDGIKTDKQFIYMRRYKDELTMSRNSFFMDCAHEFPDYDFRINGNHAECSHVKYAKDKKRKWKHIGYFIALSTAAQQKSVAFPRVTLIIFDEFIIQKGNVHYMPNEANLFNEFYNTVDRYMSKTRVLFLANAVSIMNPYFIEWDIDFLPGQEWVIKYDGFIVAHFHDSKAFAAEVFKTPFGKFIEKTEYANYAVGNQFRDNDLELIEKKTEEAKYRFTLETPSGTFSLWNNSVESLWYAQSKRPGQELQYTLIPERMSSDKFLMEYNHRILQMLRGAFSTGRLLFDAPKTRNAFREISRR